MFPYLTILRPLNCLMAAMAVFIGGFLLLKTYSVFLIWAMFAVFLITGAGNIVNDYVDMEVDRINRPKRPLASGKIKPKVGLVYAVLLFVVGISISFYINHLAFALAVVNTVLLIAYPLKLQGNVFTGNAVVSYLVGSTLIYGGSVAINPYTSLHLIALPLFLMLLASLANFSREVVKDLEDLEGDKVSMLKRLKQKVKDKVLEKLRIKGKSIALKYSERISIGIASASTAFAVIISPMPYFLGILGISYIIVLIPTDIAFLASIIVLARGENRRKYSQSNRLIKLGMLLGLISFLVGILV